MNGGNDPIERVLRAIERCVAYDLERNPYGILQTVLDTRWTVSEFPDLEAQLLVWEARAHIMLDQPEGAAACAGRAWEFDPSPESCVTLGTALSMLGRHDEVEALFDLGVTLFPGDPEVRASYAVFLGGTGRIPEAMAQLEAIDPEDLAHAEAVALAGLKAAIAAMSEEADGAGSDTGEGFAPRLASRLAGEGFGLDGLPITERALLTAAENDFKARARADLEPLEDLRASVVDGAIADLVSFLGLPFPLEPAARRLWRAYHAASPVRCTAITAWAAALILAVIRLDGVKISVPEFSRNAGAHPATTRRALRLIEGYLARIDPRIACRRFAVLKNPDFAEPSAPAGVPAPEGGNVVPFPGKHRKGGPR